MNKTSKKICIIVKRVSIIIKTVIIIIIKKVNNIVVIAFYFTLDETRQNFTLAKVVDNFLVPLRIFLEKKLNK